MMEMVHRDPEWGDGRKNGKEAATKAAWFAFALEMLPHHEVEATAPALPDRRLCLKAAKAALPTAWRRLC